MLHKIYKKEKERIGKGYIWFIVGAFCLRLTYSAYTSFTKINININIIVQMHIANTLFIVGAFLWSFAMTHIFCQIAKEDASYVEFYHNILFAIGIIWYLNSKLFFVKALQTL